jgi:hypothetical protein
MANMSSTQPAAIHPLVTILVSLIPIDKKGKIRTISEPSIRQRRTGKEVDTEVMH